MKCRIYKLAILLLLPCCVLAKQAIQIESDKVEYNHFDGTMTHLGHVVVHWQNRVLHANELVLHKNAQGDLSHMIATGSPATFEGEVNTRAQTMQGKANLIRFEILPNTVTLQDKAELRYEGDTFAGPLIKFDFNTQTISAEKHDRQRPKLIIGSKLSNLYAQKKESP